MTDATTIANDFASNINSTFSSNLASCLSANGFSSGDIASISSLYSDILGSPEISSITAICSDHLTGLGNDLDNLAKGLQGSISASHAKDNKPGGQDNYIAQDASYGKIFPEKVTVHSKVTNVPDFPAANSELTSEYPHTYGKIDTAHNWYKVNRTTGYVEFVHNSGSSIKITKTGDVSIRITGSLKFIVDSDYLLNILGNHDHVTKGHEYKASLSDFEHVIDSTARFKASDLFKILAGEVDIN